MGDASVFLTRSSRLWLDPDAAPALLTAADPRLDELAGPGFGAPVQSRRSSWVRRGTIGPFDVFAKVYDYPTTRDRLRGIGRNTALARSRAARERDALRWLSAHGFGAPRPLVVAEWRRHGLLRRALLVTEAWAGTDVETLWPTLGATDRAALRAAILAFVAALHTAGFRDRNLDPRNLLAQRTPGGSFAIAKIDSPRYRLVSPGRTDDPLARADHARLGRGLAALGER